FFLGDAVHIFLQLAEAVAKLGIPVIRQASEVKIPQPHRIQDSAWVKVTDGETLIFQHRRNVKSDQIISLPYRHVRNTLLNRTGYGLRDGLQRRKILDAEHVEFFI